MRAVTVVFSLIGLVLAASSVAANGIRNHPDPNVRFLTAVELTKGHFLASQAAYDAGQPPRAGVHASHPSQELGVKVFGAPSSHSPEMGEQVRAAMKLPGQTLDRKVSPREYAQAVERAIAMLDDAVVKVIPAAVRASPRFQVLVFAEVLWEITEEYQRSFAESKIVQDVEYQDAVGFYRRARALYTVLAPLLPHPLPVVDRELEAIGRALTSFTPPTAPVRPEQLGKSVDAIMLEFGKIIGRLNGAPKR